MPIATMVTSTAVQRFYLVVGLWLIGKSSAKETCSAGKDGTCEEKNNSYDPVKECGIFMGPSTLGEHTNMGIYTAKPIKTHDVLNYPEIAIPLVFREWGEHVPGYTDGELWDRYIWEGSVANIESYVDKDREDSRAVFVPGIGCTINGILDMHNIESTHGSTYDTAGLHRSRDPGSGAFCPYHSSLSTASVDIPAGAEIFAAYGDDWIPDIPGAQITFNNVMDKAESFIRDDYYPFVAEHEEVMSDELKEGLWEFSASNFPLQSEIFSVLPKSQPWSTVQEDLEQLPKDSWEKGRKGKTKHEADVTSVVRRFIRGQSVRDLDWLYTHPNSYCQDHIKPGLSTIPQAGRGAFATRFLPAGTVVGYSPLIHIGELGREVYTVEIPEGNDEIRKQYDLIVNYSFGHRHSSVMLTPYGGMVNFINHASGSKANVKVRWPDKELVAHKPSFLTKTPTDLRYTVDKIGLSFEYVALRDIEEGEEVFMDYGPEWEEAWKEHLKTWKPPENSENYVHHTEFNIGGGFRTEKELEENPYPSSNLITMCEGEAFNAWEYCKILERNDAGSTDEDPTYTVELLLDGSKTKVVHDFKHQTIHLTDKAFSADWHLGNVFRHEIMIPDDVIPEVWLNGPPPDPDFS